MKGNNRFKLASLVGLIIILGILYVLLISDTNEEDDVIISAENDKQIEAKTLNNEEDNKEVNNSKEVQNDNKQKIFVHISGAVRNPEVYEVEENTRVFQLIELAGGFTQLADTNIINLAEKVSDGQQIYIPTREEVKNGKINTIVSSHNQSTKININNATLEQLMELDNIGESKASSIIKYRENNGNFKSIEEIMNVEGIKESTFNKIKDKIIV